MAAKFYIKQFKPTDTYGPLFVRLQSRKHGIDYRYSIHMEAKIDAWNKAHEKQSNMDKFRDKEPEMWAKLDKLKSTLNTILEEKTVPSKEQVQTIINEVVYADVLKEQQEALAKAKAAEEEAKRVTLNKYVDKFI